MQINHTSVGEKFYLEIKGDVDASSAIEVDQTITEAITKKCYKILIDCQGLEYISSAGLGVFISHLDDVKKNGGQIIFYNMQEKVRNVFKILGLDELVPIVGNVDDAKALLK
jgi:anti-sigma B factor antagonist